MFGARSRTRTDMNVSVRLGLNQMCLPVSPLGQSVYYLERRAELESASKAWKAKAQPLYQHRRKINCVERSYSSATSSLSSSPRALTDAGTAFSLNCRVPANFWYASICVIECWKKAITSFLGDLRLIFSFP